MIDQKKDRAQMIHEICMKVLQENMEFANQVRPKPTKESSAAWKPAKSETPKASGATEGAWDATNTPGGVSDAAKAVWTKDQIVAKVMAELKTAKFANMARPKPTKESSAAWKPAKSENPKASGATEGAWEATNTPGGGSDAAKAVWTKDQIVAKIMTELKTAKFANVARPKPTKASSATQGSWDTKNTPGGVSENARQVWTIDRYKDEVQKELKNLTN